MSLTAALTRSPLVVSGWRDVRRRWPVVDWVFQDYRRYGRISLSLPLTRPDVVFVPIVGMHRSGTSCITSLLAANGLHLGDNLLGPNSINPDGFWESKTAIRINELALKSFRYDDANPAGAVPHFSRSLLRRAERFLLELSCKPVVGWKDPRTILTWPAWHELLYKNRYVVVACLRHPRSVTKSFMACDATITYENALDCWRKFNAMIASIVADVVFINFDAPLEPQIQYACGRIGLEFNSDSMSMYKSKLVHNHEQNLSTGSDAVDSLYEHLLTRWRAQQSSNASERVAVA